MIWLSNWRISQVIIPYSTWWFSWRDSVFTFYLRLFWGWSVWAEHSLLTSNWWIHIFNSTIFQCIHVLIRSIFHWNSTLWWSITFILAKTNIFARLVVVFMRTKAFAPRRMLRIWIVYASWSLPIYFWRTNSLVKYFFFYPNLFVVLTLVNCIVEKLGRAHTRADLKSHSIMKVKLISFLYDF